MASNSGGNVGGWIIIGLIGLGVWQCSKDEPSSSSSAAAWESTYEDAYVDARADAEADLAESTYESESYAYGCTEDCGGHEAGWVYAAENQFDDTSQCSGESVSFEEGCQAFVEEVQSRSQAAEVTPEPLDY